MKQGTLTPLLGIGVCVSIQFGALEHTKRFFARQNLANGRGGPDGLNLSNGQLMTAGVFAGLANSVVSGPVEHIRIRECYLIYPNCIMHGIHVYLTYASIGLQTQSATKPVYAGPFDAIKKIYSSHGISGIYKGQVATLWREASGYGVYFLAYELLMQREMEKKGIRRDQVNPANAVLFGAAAGYAVRIPRCTFDSNQTYAIHRLAAVGSYLPYRHDQISNADRWILNFGWTKVQIYRRLYTNCLAIGGDWRLHEGVRSHIDQVRPSPPASTDLCVHARALLDRHLLMEPLSLDSRWPAAFSTRGNTDCPDIELLR